MKKLVLFITIIVSLTTTLSGQIFDPVSWSFSYEDLGEGRYELVFKATIEEGSHLYGIDIPSGGPIPTSFTFSESVDYKLRGEIKSLSEGEEVFDTAFEMDIVYYSNEAEFRQVIESELKSFSVEGYVTYMACDDERCSPPQDVEFNISVSSGSELKVNDHYSSQYYQQYREGKRLIITSQNNSELSTTINIH